MSRPHKKWEDLKPSRQLALYKAGDPRVPEGWKPNPVGRPKGYKVPQEVIKRTVSTRVMGYPPAKQAERAAAAIRTLLAIYGSREAVIQELRRDIQV